MSKKYSNTPLVSEPRYIGVFIEQETYDILSNAAHKAGDKISKLIRNALDEAANKINEKKI